MQNLNVIDIIILLIFFCSILIGFIRGFITEVVAFVTTIAAFIVAIMFSVPLANAFTQSQAVQAMVSQSSSAIGVNTAQPASYVAIGIAFFLIFLGVSLVGMVVKYILNIPFQMGILGFGNRILGAAFGGAKGFIYNLVLIFLIQLTPLSAQALWVESHYVNAFQPAVLWLSQLVSPTVAQLKNKLGDTIQDLTPISP